MKIRKNGMVKSLWNNFGGCGDLQQGKLSNFENGNTVKKTVEECVDLFEHFLEKVRFDKGI